MAVVHGMQQEFALPAALLHGKAQLLADAAGAHCILGKQNRVVVLQCIAYTVRQRVKLRQLDAVRLHAMLGQQILGGNDLLGLGTVADKRDTCAIDRVQHIVACASAGFSPPRA